MSLSQRILTAILPKSWAEEMCRDSMAWKIKCPCGHERSVWETGGIRWKAKGNPRRLMKCPKCGNATWHTVYYKPDGAPKGS